MTGDSLGRCASGTTPDHVVAESRLTREVTACIQSVFADSGDFLAGPSRQGVVQLLNEDVQLQVNFIVASRGDTATRTVNPIVSLRHEAVEGLFSQFLGRRRDPHMGTVSRPLLALMPPSRSSGWLTTSANCSDVARDMLAEVRDVAVPRLRQSASLEGILDCIDKGWGERGRLMFRKPIVLSLLGRASEAEAAANDIAQVSRGLKTAWGEEASTLVHALRKHLEQGL